MSTKRIEALFAALAVTLCDDFYKCFPTEMSQQVAKQIWEEDLRGFTDQQLIDARKKVSCFFKKGDRFNFPYFRKICEEIRGDTRNKVLLSSNKLCVINTCPNIGVISPEIRCNTWYCSDHFLKR